MTATTIKKVQTVSTTSPTVEETTSQEKELVKITGVLTSPIQLRGENTPEPYYYSFIRLKGQSIDLPVIFKIKDQEINLKKNDKVELTGNYSNSNKNIRKSFTAYSYHLFSEKRIRKKHSDLNQEKTETNIFTNHA